MIKKENVYRQLLHDAGLKATPARIKILHFCEDAKKPINIKDISKKDDNIDIVTIYRTIDVFVDKGIVRPVHICGDTRFFELTALPHHHHIVCKKCGMIEDINECDLDSAIIKIKKHSKKFKIITEHTFELFGMCNKCAK